MLNDVLLVGGAGYVGTVLSQFLIKKNINVCCIDNFLYGHSFSIRKLESNNKFKFYQLDFSNTKEISKLLKKYKNIVFLASVVGDPITKKYPLISKKINEDFTIKFINLCISNKIEKFIFISTCSNYGMIPDSVEADENYKLDPISLYAKSKVKIEKYLLTIKKNNTFQIIIYFLIISK